MRDFLVQIRVSTRKRLYIIININYFIVYQEYTGEDDSDLYLEEREQALQNAQLEKRKIQLSVPGILNPHEVPEEMQD